ncbi:hypothetical protein [Flavobacterium pectinovorum]|uniref:Uncharacterized protein n=1 Tax=Flavobacterium pectinovorum TaxID=29533 RepID=A0A502ECC4_9FLAO|nr:hypothetical protein [Flavobacterium pectinovorum]TPG35333.1 hypothetical protein EAH81_21455 [Flavobacterium pectinovorum]
MGRTTEFYKLDAEKAKKNLILDLSSKTKFKKSFENFIIERKNEFKDDFDVTFDNVVQKVSSNINTILPSELWELTFWLGEIEYERRTFQGESYEKMYNELYINNGIESLYEIQNRNAYGFMFQYGNFTDYFEVNEIREMDSGHNVDTKDFVRFLDYMILLMKKILDADLDKSEYKHVFSKEEIEEISKIENLNQENKLLFQRIEAEFVWLKQNFIKEKEEEDLDKNYSSRNADYATIFCADSFFEHCIRIKNSLNEINTNILIVDSI